MDDGWNKPNPLKIQKQHIMYTSYLEPSLCRNQRPDNKTLRTLTDLGATGKREIGPFLLALGPLALGLAVDPP